MKHVHQYERQYIGRDKPIMACALPDCLHYLQPPECAMGKRSLCHHCHREMILDHEAMEQMRPICRNCREGKDERIVGILEKYFPVDEMPKRQT
jgi:hypothetical protein